MAISVRLTEVITDGTLAGLALIYNVSPSRSSLLENLRIDRDGAKFALDAREVRIPGDVSSPSVYAFNSLFVEAYAAYAAHQRRQDAGLVAWLGFWFGRVFRDLGPADDHTGLIDVRVGRPYLGAPAAAQLAPGGGSGEPKAGQNGGRAAPPTAGVIQAVYADKEGVHVFWHQPADGKESASGAKRGVQTTELVFALNSEIARRLQRCYDELEKLGYKTIGLDGLSAAAVQPVQMGEDPAKSPVSVAKGAPAMEPADPVSSAIAASPTGANSSPTGQAAPKPTPTFIVMRLHPTPPDLATRTLVSPVGDAGKPEVLLAPERVLRALRGASGSGRVDDDRLNFLRCVKDENGLRIVDVGFGAAQGNDREPARWEDAKAWWERQGKALAATQPTMPVPTAAKPTATDAVIPGPIFEPGRFPLRVGFEPGVSGGA